MESPTEVLPPLVGCGRKPANLRHQGRSNRTCPRSGAAAHNTRRRQAALLRVRACGQPGNPPQKSYTPLVGGGRKPANLRHQGRSSQLARNQTQLRATPVAGKLRCCALEQCGQPGNLPQKSYTPLVGGGRKPANRRRQGVAAGLARDQAQLRITSAAGKPCCYALERGQPWNLPQKSCPPLWDAGASPRTCDTRAVATELARNQTRLRITPVAGKPRCCALEHCGQPGNPHKNPTHPLWEAGASPRTGGARA